MLLCVFIIFFQKIERLKGELHLLDADSKQKNKHIFFVDSKKEGKYKYLLDNSTESVVHKNNRKQC